LPNKVLIFAFGGILAQGLNLLSWAWPVPPNSWPIALIAWEYTVWAFSFLAISFPCLLLLRSLVGLEDQTKGHLSGNSYRLKTVGGGAKSAVELTEELINMFESSDTTVTKEKTGGKEVTRLKFDLDPNSYAITFTPLSDDEFEVDLLSWRREADIVYEADREAAELLTVMMDAAFQKWKNEGRVQDWSIDSAPKYFQRVQDETIGRLTRGNIWTVARSSSLWLRERVGWVLRSKEEIGGIIQLLAAILTLVGLLVGLLMKFLPSAA